MKRIFYICCFTFFGLLVATVIHAILELIALEIIFNNPEQFANTIWWEEWFPIHNTISIVLWITGFVAGCYGGVRFWDILYVKKSRTS